MPQPNPFGYFQTGSEIIRLAVMRYIRFPPLLRIVEGLQHTHGINVSHKTVRFWRNRFGPMLALKI